jgi:RNA polymerase sigma-70 factor (ECF subfamily)
VDAFASEPLETRQLLDRIQQGEREALGQLLARYHNFLLRIVELRFDPRLRARVDPADVVQQAQLEVVKRIGDYLGRCPMPFRLWLRQTTLQCLVDIQRHHLGAGNRAIGWEAVLPDHSSFQLAERLFADSPSPSSQVARGEVVGRVRAAVAWLADDDREILLLRHFEDLPNHEAAQVLGIEPAAASKRYGRALLRLHQLLRTGGPGGASA